MAALAAPVGGPAVTGAAARLLPEGFEVLVTAVHPSEREQLQALARQHGFQLLTAVGKAPPHLVISRNVRSPKYRAVVRANPAVPVVTPEWLLACAREGRRLPYDGYRVGPFLGLTVCFSGISTSRKQALAGQVLDAGGQHSAQLDRKCTHLVTVSTESEKYKFAQRERIICVQPRWVDDCLARGCCLDEAQFLVLDREDQTGQNRLAEAAMQPLHSGAMGGLLTDEATMLSMPAPSGATGCFGSASETRLPSGGEPSCGAVSRGGDSQQPQRQQQGTSQRAASRLRQEAGAVAQSTPVILATGVGPAGPSAPLIQLSPFDGAAVPSSSYDDLDWDDDTPLFLDSCSIHLAGCTPKEQVEMLRLVREGAAKRFAVLTPGLTHIVVGSDLTTAEAADLAEYAASNRQTAFVTLDWLRQCALQRERLPTGDGFCIPISALQGLRKKVPAMEHVDAEARQLLRSSSGLSGGTEDMSGARQASAGPLAGCYFTLAALRAAGATDEESRVKELILQYGGRVFNAHTIAIVPNKRQAYAICPHSLLQQDVHLLRSSYPDFKLVDEKQRFTPYWLECSLIAGRPLPAQRNAPLHQPLSFPLPVPGMEKVLASISGYEDASRAVIKRTLELLGGTTTDSMTRRNTHLLVPDPSGSKYLHCGLFGVCPVTADWLLDSIANGQLMPEEHYHPAAFVQPPGVGGAEGGGAAGAEAAMGGAGVVHSNLPSEEGATRGSGGSGMPSQIGVTQFPRAASAPGAAPVALPTSLYQAVVAGDRSQQAAAERPLGAGAAAIHGRGITQAEQLQPQAPAASQRGRSLRERMSQGRQPPARRSNDENSMPAAAGAAPNLMDADMAVPHWSTGAAAPQRHPQVQQQGNSTLDALLLDMPADSVARASGTHPSEQQQQQQQQQRSLLDEALGDLGGAAPNQQQVLAAVFGSSSPPSARCQALALAVQPGMEQSQAHQHASVAAVPAAQPAALAAARPGSAVPLQRSPASGIASSGSAAQRSGGSGPTSGGRRSGRSAGASRLRPPDSGALAAMAAAEAAMGLAGSAAASDAAHAVLNKAAGQVEEGCEVPVLMGGAQAGQAGQQGRNGGGGEGPDIEAMLDKMCNMLANMAGPPALGSQQDMPPPPPRGRGCKRQAEGGGDTDGSISLEDSGRQTRTRAKRGQSIPAADTPLDAGSGRTRRRSERGLKRDHASEVEMSQQVGYDTSPTVVPARVTRSNGADAAAKEKLRQMARLRGPAQKDKTDILMEMLG